MNLKLQKGVLLSGLRDEPQSGVIDPFVGARQHRMLFAGLRSGRKSAFVKAGLIIIGLMFCVPLIVGIFFRG